mmetsp:Transcript_72108/g.168767  ORF Transcript_72108/g.168767 Transcript_72108/m.168767 type:complete len:230 (-) Transcript_72108:831-1520(-)
MARWLSLDTRQEVCPISSADMDSRALFDESVMERLCQLLLCLWGLPGKGTIWAFLQCAERWWKPDALRRKLFTARIIHERVDHISICALCVVAIRFLRPAVGITPVAICSTIPLQVPLLEWNCLDVIKLVFPCSKGYIRESHAYRRHVGCYLHQSSNLHKRTKRAEEEAHQILMAPVDNGMAIKEPAHGSCMGEVIIHCPDSALKAFELWVHSDTCAVNLVEDFCIMLL